MAIEVLQKPAKCSECGAILKPGTKVKVYTRRDGKKLVYGFDCHGRKGEGKQERKEPEALSADWETVSGQLADIQSMLMQILDILQARSNGVANDEGELTAADWRKFWMKVKRLGFDEKQVHEIYSVNSLKEIVKTREDMERVLAELEGLAF
jgi:hypothetical protein